MSAEIYLVGAGYFSPTQHTLSDVIEGVQREPIKPPCKLVASRMKRATSMLTRMSVEVAIQATEAAGWLGEEPSPFAMIFGSAHGEIQIAIEQMKMMKEEPFVVSPARFKNSVHNTAAGLFSIAAKNKGFATAIAGGAETFAMCLLEAFSLLKTNEAQRVLVTTGEETLPEPIADHTEHDNAAVALAFQSVPSESAIARVSLPQFGPAVETEFGLQSNHSVGPALALLLSARRGEFGSFALGSRASGFFEGSTKRGWSLEMSPV